MAPLPTHFALSKVGQYGGHLITKQKTQKQQKQQRHKNKRLLMPTPTHFALSKVWEMGDT